MVTHAFDSFQHLIIHFYLKRMIREICNFINRNIFYIFLILLVSFFLRRKKVIY